MGRLVVEARGNPLDAAAGNRNPAVILVSVTDSSGTAVGGLTRVHLDVETLLGPDGPTAVVQSFGAAERAGYYGLEVVPAGTATWVRGEIDFAVAVRSPGGDLGQTLASLRVP